MIKSFLFSDNGLSRFVRSIINYFPFNNSFHTRENEIEISNALLRNSKIRIYGVGNKIKVGKNVYLTNLNIVITGNNNELTIKDNVTGQYLDICFEDDHNFIYIGECTNFAGKTHLACIESTGISIGAGCLFSSEIVVRTGDSHSILNMEGQRINPSKNVEIEDHVWVGHRVLINKGSKVGKDSVVGTGAIVTSKIDRTNVVIVGIPARVVSENINWNIDRSK